MMINHTAHVCVALFIALALSACGGGGSGSGPQTGTLSVALTDAPFPATDGCVSAAIICVSQVSAKGDAGFVPLLEASGDPVEIDLYELRAGLSERLSTSALPTGAYREIRLVVDESRIEFSDGSPARTFKIPSGSSSGLKLKIDPPILIAEGQTTDLTLDVSLTESFHTTGLGGEPTCDDLKEGESKVIFRPVVRVINEATVGLVRGVVLDGKSAALGDAEILVYEAGTTVDQAAVPTLTTLSTPASMQDRLPEGSYALALKPGAYDIYVRVQGADQAVLVSADVAVTKGETTEHDLVVPAP